jgi:hypothetical protein
MDVMVWIAMIMMGCLAGPLGDDRVREGTPSASADAPGVYVAVAARPPERSAASRAGRHDAASAIAVLGDIDDDETEEESPSAVLPPASDPHLGRARIRTTDRPGTGPFRWCPIGRIPLRC